MTILLYSICCLSILEISINITTTKKPSGMYSTSNRQGTIHQLPSSLLGLLRLLFVSDPNGKELLKEHINHQPSKIKKHARYSSTFLLLKYIFLFRSLQHVYRTHRFQACWRRYTKIQQAKYKGTLTACSVLEGNGFHSEHVLSDLDS